MAEDSSSMLNINLLLSMPFSYIRYYSYFLQLEDQVSKVFFALRDWLTTRRTQLKFLDTILHCSAHLTLRTRQLQ